VRDGNRRCDVVNLVQAPLKNRVWTYKEGTFSLFSVSPPPLPPLFPSPFLGGFALHLPFIPP